MVTRNISRIPAVGSREVICECATPATHGGWREACAMIGMGRDVETKVISMDRVVLGIRRVMGV